MKEFFSQTDLGYSGHTFWCEEEQYSVKDSRKIEGGNGGVQMEASVQLHKVRSEDTMVGPCDVLALFSQVSGVKQEESCLYLAPLEQMDFRVPQVSKGLKVLLSSTSPGGGIGTFSGFSHTDHWSCPHNR